MCLFPSIFFPKAVFPRVPWCLSVWGPEACLDLIFCTDSYVCRGPWKECFILFAKLYSKGNPAATLGNMSWPQSLAFLPVSDQVLPCVCCMTEPSRVLGAGYPPLLLSVCLGFSVDKYVTHVPCTDLCPLLTVSQVDPWPLAAHLGLG